MRFFHKVMVLKDADGMTNCVDPHQRAPSEAVRTQSTLLVQTCPSENLSVVHMRKIYIRMYLYIYVNFSHVCEKSNE